MSMEGSEQNDLLDKLEEIAARAHTEIMAALMVKDVHETVGEIGIETDKKFQQLFDSAAVVYYARIDDVDALSEAEQIEVRRQLLDDMVQILREGEYMEELTARRLAAVMMQLFEAE